VSHADDVFIKNFLAVLGALVLFTIFSLFLSSAIGSYTWQRMQSDPKLTQSRIEPLAQVRVGEPGQEPPAPEQKEEQQVAAAETAAAQEETAGGDGQQVYQSVCAACHVAGVAGAPKLTDTEAWEQRAEQGFDALVQSVINGKGAMPPKAGQPSLTEQEIRDAVSHMLAQAGVSAPGQPGQQAQAEQQAQPKAQQEQEPAQAQPEQPAQAQQAQEQEAQESAQTATGVDEAAAEQIYQSVCSACHVAGVAGAPKLTDTGAWEQRAQQGFDALVQSVVNGKGAMPPKGGRPSLTEAETRAVVRYMLDEAGVSAGGAGQAAAEKETAQAQEAAAREAAAEPASQASGGDAKAGKSVYQSTCSACHQTGVAGAPKLGDAAAWKPRAEQGFDALVQSVINGKGAMPPKGGSPALTREQARNAVQYMVDEAGVSAE